ncbi:MAG: alpha/beta hydrolase [Nocardioides sp.]
MAWRTKAFAVVLKAISSENTPETMPTARAKRAALVESRAGRLVFGTDHPGTTLTERSIELGGFTSRLRIHTPTARTWDPLPIVVNYHGGGWTQGAPEQSRWIASRVAVGVGAIVVSPTYRLAPEHPYPAAVDDAWTILEWVAAYASELGGDPTRIAVMGDSAGGNLAAVTALKAREAGIPKLRCQVLIYPGVEMYDRWPSEDENAEAPVLTSVGMRTFAHMYMAELYGAEDWQASPIRAASHADLPPALIITAGHDPLRDNGTRYADAMRGDGSLAELRNHPDAIHGFVSLPGMVPAAKRAREEIVRFLTDHLA